MKSQQLLVTALLFAVIGFIVRLALSNSDLWLALMWLSAVVMLGSISLAFRKK